MFGNLIEHKKKRTNATKTRPKTRASHPRKKQQLLESLSKKMGMQITEDFLTTIPILKTEYGEVLDEVYGKTDDLIKP